MANQVQDIFVRLNIKNEQAITALRSSFRELGKVIEPVNLNISELRQEIIDFGQTNARSEQLIRGQIDALKGLQRQAAFTSTAYSDLSNDIESLNAELRGSTVATDQQREALLRTARAGTQTALSIRNTIQGLQQLQQQTRPGSAAFDQLSNDIRAATQNLENLTTTTRTFAQVFSSTLRGGFGATPEIIGRQISTLRQGLQGLRFDSQQYLDTLERIRLLSLVESNRSGRANVIAGFQAYQSREFQAGYADPNRLPDLPDTTAALNQRYQELSAQLLNVTRGSSEYVNVSIQMADIQRQLRTELTGTADAFARLAREEAAASRRAGKIQGIQEYYGAAAQAGSPSVAPGIGGYRDPATGALIARGAYGARDIRPGTAYERPIGPEPLSANTAAAQAQLKQAQERMLQLMQQYQVDRIQLEAKYNQISLEQDAAAYAKKDQQARRLMDAELADFDRRLEAADRRRARRRKGFTGLGAAQTAGAVISGGIFGGPLGFFGGLAGAAAGFAAGGGPSALGGAFAGSAVGAQVDIFRQSLSAAAEYAASIGKLRIALAGVVSTTQEYQAALNNISKASQDFNIPLGDATQQFTKLSAAVLGSGGTLQQADTAFRGLSSAIIATGGSQEDLNGALLAAIQVYSKGKVTAEELTGQIGERLAGAFAKFAESTNKSTKQLSESLRKGEVTIADFNKFLKFLQEDYKKTTAEIANAPEQAGVRLERALDDLKLKVGELLQPIGASFQNFATDVVKTLNTVIEKIKELTGLTPKTTLEDLISGKTTPEEIKARIAALKKEIEVSTPSIGSQLFLSTYPNQSFDQGIGNIDFGSRKDVSAQLKERQQLVDLLKEYELLQKRIGSQSKAQADAATAAAEAERKKLLEQGGKAYLQAVTQREEQLFDARKQYEEQIAEIRKSAIEQARDLERQFTEDRLQSEREIAAQRRNIVGSQQDIQFLRRKIAGEDPGLVDFEQRIAEITRQAEEKRISAVQKAGDAERKQKESIAEFQKKTAEALNKANEAYAKRIGTIQVNFAKTVESILDDVTKRTAARLIKAQEVINLLAQRNSLNMSRVVVGLPAIPMPEAITRSNQVIYPKGTEPVDAFSKLDVKLQNALDLILNPTLTQIRPQLTPVPAAPNFTAPSFLATAAQGASSARETQKQIEVQAINTDEYRQKLTAAQELLGAVQKENAQILTQTFMLNEVYEKNLNPQLAESLRLLAQSYKYDVQKIQAAGLTKEDTERLTEQYSLQVSLLRTATIELARQQEYMKYRQDTRLDIGFQEGINQYVESIGTLRKATADLAQNGIKGIEDAIFSLVTTGTANFREFAANILQETARVIIQQLILRTILQNLFPSPGNTFADYSSVFGKIKPSASGNIFASNGIQPFAMGGIVNQPTLFRYANGGVPGLGLMGEAGPEAIVPLQRGANGKLGIAGGGGTYNVTVNVEAGGATMQTQGDPGQGAQLGRLIAGAVQSELIKQQRPGGLLAQR